MLMQYRTFRWSVYALFVFLMAPILIVIVSSFNDSPLLAFPPEEWSLRWYRELAGSGRWLTAAWTSLQIAWWSTLTSLVIGMMAAFAVAWRRPWRGSALYANYVMLPLAFPFTATGVALLFTLRGYGMLGSFRGFLLAHILITLPYTFRAVLGTLRSLDPTFREAALMHGATPVRAFVRVVLPLLRPGIMAGFIFAFLLSFDEVAIGLLIIGPFISTLPVELFSQVIDAADPTVAAVSTIQIVVVGLLLIVAQRLFGLRVFTETHG